MVWKSSPEIRARIKAAYDVAESSVSRSLVAIYSDYITKTGFETVDQTGTAFLVLWRGRQVLVTAKHSLFGPDGFDDPSRKSVFLDGRLHRLGELGSTTLFSHPSLDISAFPAHRYSVDRCLPADTLQPVRATPKLLTVFGYLARDFRRSEADSTLLLRPHIYSSKLLHIDEDVVRMHYSRSKSIGTGSGSREHAPVPSGLSGGPMLDTNALRRGQIRILGIFTEWARGFGSGVNVVALAPLLDSLSE